MSSLIVLWSEKMLDMISIFLNVLRLDLWPKMWSVLENVPCVLEKKVSSSQKKKNEFNLLQGKKSTSLEAWEKETSNTITLKNNNEKAEKYCTNEGTN